MTWFWKKKAEIRAAPGERWTAPADRLPWRRWPSGMAPIWPMTPGYPGIFRGHMGPGSGPVRHAMQGV